MFLVCGELTYEVRSVSQVKTSFLHLGRPYCCEISLRVFCLELLRATWEGGREGGREGGSCNIRLGFPDCAGKRGEILRFCCQADGTAASVASQPQWQPQPDVVQATRYVFPKKTAGNQGWLEAGPAALRKPCGSRPLATRWGTCCLWCDTRGHPGLCSQTPAPRDTAPARPRLLSFASQGDEKSWDN